MPGKHESRSAGQTPDPRRARFAALLLQLVNPHEAAVQAGYPAGEAGATATELLQDPDFLALLQRAGETDRTRRRGAGEALQGLWRLAFGSASDAVRLVLSPDDAPPPDPAAMDLFLVSEIKRPRGGGLELKLHDRLPAIMALLEREEAAQSLDQGGGLYAALHESMQTAQQQQDDDPEDQPHP